MKFDEFADCQAWWPKRTENERAWRVSISDIEANGYNLDLKNPNRPDTLAYRSPMELLAEMLQAEREILARIEEIGTEIRQEGQ